MQLYVQAKSKKEIKDKLAQNENVLGVEYTPFSIKNYSLNDVPEGTVIKIFEKYVSGSPYAKAYGNIIKTKEGKTSIK